MKHTLSLAAFVFLTAALPLCAQDKKPANDEYTIVFNPGLKLRTSRSLSEERFSNGSESAYVYRGKQFPFQINIYPIPEAYFNKKTANMPLMEFVKWILNDEKKTTGKLFLSTEQLSLEPVRLLPDVDSVREVRNTHPLKGDPFTTVSYFLKSKNMATNIITYSFAQDAKVDISATESKIRSLLYEVAEK